MMTLMTTAIKPLFLITSSQSPGLLLFLPLLVLIDFYVLNGLRGLSNKWRFLNKKSFTNIYWIFSALLIGAILFSTYSRALFGIKFLLLVVFFFFFLLKICFVFFLIIDDCRRLALHFLRRDKNAVIQNTGQQTDLPAIPRSEFLLKAGLLAGAVPLAALRLNMKTALYDYHIKRQTIYLPNLPKAFDGIKIGQISDLHAGNFRDKKAVLRGVEMLMREKADIIFFTGDLVDEASFEFTPYFDVFKHIKAPLGVYSSLGNHDYGDYGEWPSLAAKQKNFQEIVAVQKELGWDLLRNENRRLKVNGEEIGILGVENWGEFSKFPKYGKMDLVVKNTDDLPVKLLLSHDPSHWRAQILPHYPQIDVMFSGHTHGMQCGVQTNNFQWSPIEYIYKEWCGLYQENNQQLYVNVGFGFLRIEGRVGILPEITIFELKAASNPGLVKV
jgi:uncharacterized protein